MNSHGLWTCKFWQVGQGLNKSLHFLPWAANGKTSAMELLLNTKCMIVALLRTKHDFFRLKVSIARSSVEGRCLNFVSSKFTCLRVDGHDCRCCGCSVTIVSSKRIECWRQFVSPKCMSSLLQVMRMELATWYVRKEDHGKAVCCRPTITMLDCGKAQWNT